MGLLLLLAFVTVSALGAAGSNLGVSTAKAIEPGGGGGGGCYDYYFSQTGIPSSVPWTVTVDGFPHTYQGSFSVCLTDNPVSYTYDSHTMGPPGTRYVCLTGCSGSLSAEDNTAKATYGTQYSVTFSAPTGLGSDASGTVLTVNSSTYGYSDFSPTVSFWVWPSSVTTFSFKSPVPGNTGVRYIFTGSNDTSPLTGLTGPVTITSTYSVQYQVTFDLPNGLGSDATGTILTINSTNHYYGGFSVKVWVWPSSVTTFSFKSPVPGNTGVRYIFTGSNDTSPLTGLTGPVTITSTYSVQYQVTFEQTGLGSDATGTVLVVNSTSYGYSDFSPSGVQVWVWPSGPSGTTFSFTSPVPGSAGVRYVLTGSSDTSPLNSLTGPETVTSTYSVQYQVTFSSPSGLGVDASGTILTINGTSTYGYSDFSPSGVQVWVWPSSGTTFSFNSPVSGNPGVRYIFTGSSGGSSPLTGLTGPVTITSTYSVQYQVTFDQTGSGASVLVAWSFGNGTSGSTYAPFSLWADSTTSSVSFTYPSPIAGTTGVRYSLVSVSPESSYSISDGPVTITGTYQTQYYLTVSSAYGAPTGQAWYDAGATASSSVTSPVSGGPGTRYVATGFTGTGSAPSSGSGLTVSFTINQPSSVTWNWVTQYELTVSVSPPWAGSVSVSTGFVDYSAPVSIKATPRAGYLFGGWVTTGVSCAGGSSSNPCTFDMPDNPASVTATFLTPTTLMLDCSPSRGTVGVPESCTAYVMNNDLLYFAKATGTVTFAGTLPPGMPASCSLTGGMGIFSSCTVSWTPTPGTEGSYHVTASYGGDATHAQSSGSTALTVGKRSVSVSVTCSGPYQHGTPTTCTVTVKDSSPGTPITPTGTVTLSSSGPGKFSSVSCFLVPGVPGTASCHVTFTPASKGSYTVSASYGGDTDHYAGATSAAFKAT